MSERGVTDEMLMAFADGELPAEEAQRVARAVAEDPTLAARVEAFRAARRATRESFHNLLQEPVPDRLVAAALSSPAAGTLLPFRPRRPVMRLLLPLAATVLLAVGVGGFFLGRGTVTLVPVAAAPLLGGSPALTAALAETPSGGEATVELAGGPAQLRLVDSYRVAEGACRVFTLRPTDGGALRGLACERGQGWRVELAVADPAAAEKGYAPASGGALGSLDAYLDALEAEGPLDPAAEEALKAKGWR